MRHNTSSLLVLPALTPCSYARPARTPCSYALLVRPARTPCSYALLVRPARTPCSYMYAIPDGCELLTPNHSQYSLNVITLAITFNPLTLTTYPCELIPPSHLPLSSVCYTGLQSTPSGSTHNCPSHTTPSDCPTTWTGD